MHKELPVVKPYAITHPWTVMIHVQYTDITYRAVMTPFRFKRITYQAVTFSLALLVTYVKTLLFILFYTQYNGISPGLVVIVTIKHQSIITNSK